MRRLLSLLLLAVPFVFAATAHAATVSIQRTVSTAHGSEGVFDELVVEAAPGETNRMRVDFDAGALSWRIRDEGAPITAGDACTVAGDTATCTSPPVPGASAGFRPIVTARIALGDGDDRLVLASAPPNVTIDGGAGADDLEVLAGADTVTVDGGPGPDHIRSDDPHVRLDYSNRSTAVNVTPDGVADDGAVGEGDNVEGVYGELDGTPYDDTLVASTAPVRIDAGDGADRIIGSPGADIIDAGGGENSVVAGAGDDLVHERTGAMHGDLSGGPGKDSLGVIAEGINPFFGPETITLDDVANDGPAGGTMNVHSDFEEVDLSIGRLVGTDADEILSVDRGTVDGRGGNDLVSGGGTLIGGPGRDFIQYTGFDPNAAAIQARDGEPDIIDCQSAQPPMSLPADIQLDLLDRTTNCTPAMAWQSPPRVLRPNRRGFVTVRLSCDAPPGTKCDGPVVLRSPATPSTVYGRGSLGGIGVGKVAGVRVRLAKRWRAALRRGRHLNATLVADTERTKPRSARRALLGTATLEAPRR